MRTEIAALDTRLSTQIAEVRTEIAGLDTRLSTQIADLRTEQRTANAGLEARISAMETRLTWRIVGGAGRFCGCSRRVCLFSAVTARAEGSRQPAGSEE